MSPGERAARTGRLRHSPVKRALAAIVALALMAAGAVILARPDGDDGKDDSTADRGRALFVQRFTPAQGLGPLFNERSCSGCHLRPSLGGVGRRGLATALRVGQLRAGRFDPMIGRGGPFARMHSVAELGTACPVAAGIPAGANVSSVRNAPALFGSGLIDAISDREIRAGAAREPDGVSGRPNLVRGADGRVRVGRFGWKADTPTLAEFVAEAFRNEMGVTSPAAPAFDAAGAASPGGACGRQTRAADLGRDAVAAVVGFVASLPAPAPAPASRRAHRAGEQVFRQTGCAACHVAVLHTSTRDVALYSDLLLHDMGPLLDDRVDQASARGREWRTAPLWGLSRRTRYLHDGRTQSLEAAILAHGGEARRARGRFRSLATADRRALVAFLNSL
jgi:CxxC motif-containing protein (DUF1111 family)